MEFNVGAKVRISKPTNPDSRITDWIASMDCWDGRTVTLDECTSYEPKAWNVKECNWQFEECWMTLVANPKFKPGDKVILRKPNPNNLSPMWIDGEMDPFDGKEVTLTEKANVFLDSWKVAGGTSANYSFQENWMTLVKNPKEMKEEETKTVERIGPDVKTNDFPKWETYETTNPALHMLYVHYALWNLKDLKSCLRKLNKTSQIMMLSAQSALQTEIRTLIETDPAYRHAAALLFAGIRPLPRGTQSPRYPLLSEEKKPKLNPKLFPTKDKCDCGSPDGQCIA